MSLFLVNKRTYTRLNKSRAFVKHFRVTKNCENMAEINSSFLNSWKQIVKTIVRQDASLIELSFGRKRDIKIRHSCVITLNNKKIYRNIFL